MGTFRKRGQSFFPIIWVALEQELCLSSRFNSLWVGWACRASTIIGLPSIRRLSHKRISPLFKILKPLQMSSAFHPILSFLHLPSKLFPPCWIKEDTKVCLDLVPVAVPISTSVPQYLSGDLKLSSPARSWQWQWKKSCKSVVYQKLHHTMRIISRSRIHFCWLPRVEWYCFALLAKLAKYGFVNFSRLLQPFSFHPFPSTPSNLLQNFWNWSKIA